MFVHKQGCWCLPTSEVMSGQFTQNKTLIIHVHLPMVPGNVSFWPRSSVFFFRGVTKKGENVRVQKLLALQWLLNYSRLSVENQLFFVCFVFFFFCDDNIPILVWPQTGGIDVNNVLVWYYITLFKS